MTVHAWWIILIFILGILDVLEIVSFDFLSELGIVTNFLLIVIVIILFFILINVEKIYLLYKNAEKNPESIQNSYKNLTKEHNPLKTTKDHNPLKISAAGYTANEITATINNGKISPTKKSAGEYSARPSKKGKATVSLYANVDGKRTKMGDMEFRVKEVPPPKAKIYGSRMVDGVVVMDKIKMVNAGGVLAELKDFDFKGVRYTVISYRLSGIYKGEQLKEDAKGPKFTKKMEGIIKNTKAGNSITISNIKAKRTDAKNTRVRPLDPLVIELK